MASLRLQRCVTLYLRLNTQHKRLIYPMIASIITRWADRNDRLSEAVVRRARVAAVLWQRIAAVAVLLFAPDASVELHAIVVVDVGPRCPASRH